MSVLESRRSGLGDSTTGPVRSKLTPRGGAARDRRRPHRGRRRLLPAPVHPRIVRLRVSAPVDGAGRDDRRRVRPRHGHRRVPHRHRQPHPHAVDHRFRFALHADADADGVLLRRDRDRQHRGHPEAHRADDADGPARDAPVPMALLRPVRKPVPDAARRRRPGHGLRQPVDVRTAHALPPPSTTCSRSNCSDD